jgi:hypothetical protein
MERWEGFSQCPGCGFDIMTGEGVRSCAYGDCPYLPDELKVTCDDCMFNFLTMEGNSPCEDPMACPHGEEPRAHVTNLRKWAEEHGKPAAGG